MNRPRLAALSAPLLVLCLLPGVRARATRAEEALDIDQAVKSLVALGKQQAEINAQLDRAYKALLGEAMGGIAADRATREARAALKKELATKEARLAKAFEMLTRRMLLSRQKLEKLPGKTSRQKADLLKAALARGERSVPEGFRKIAAALAMPTALENLRTSKQVLIDGVRLQRDVLSMLDALSGPDGPEK